MLIAQVPVRPIHHRTQAGEVGPQCPCGQLRSRLVDSWPSYYLEEYYNTGIRHGWREHNFPKSEWDYLANNFNIEIDREDPVAEAVCISSRARVSARFKAVQLESVLCSPFL